MTKSKYIVSAIALALAVPVAITAYPRAAASDDEYFVSDSRQMDESAASTELVTQVFDDGSTLTFDPVTGYTYAYAMPDDIEMLIASSEGAYQLDEYGVTSNVVTQVFDDGSTLTFINYAYATPAASNDADTSIAL